MASGLRLPGVGENGLQAPLPFRGCRPLPVEPRISPQPKRHSSVLGVRSDSFVTTFAVSPKRRQFPLCCRDLINAPSQPSPNRTSEAQVGVRSIVHPSSALPKTLHLRLVSRKVRGN